MGIRNLFDFFNNEEDVHIVKTDTHKVEKDKPNDMFEDYHDKKNFSLLWMIIAIVIIIIGFKFKDIKTYIKQNLSLDKAVEYLQGNEIKNTNIEYDSADEGFEMDTAYNTLSNYIENYPVLYYALSSKDKKMFVSYFNDDIDKLTVDTLKMPEAFDIQFSGFILVNSNDNLKQYYNTKDITSIEKQEDTYKLHYTINSKAYSVKASEKDILMLFPENVYFKIDFWKIISNIISKNYSIVQYGDDKNCKWAYYTFTNDSCTVYFQRDTVG